MRPPDDTSAESGLEPGSFRDPESRVFYSGGEVYRALSADGLSDFEALDGRGPARRRAARAHRARGEHRGAARPPRARARRGAPARAHPVRVVPVRVDVLDAEGRRARAAGPAPRGARARHGPEGLHALQRPVPRRAPGVRGHRLVRAPARGRAVGGLPPVLHALPVSAAAPGREGRAVPPLDARVDRRDQAGGDGVAALVPGPLPARRCSPTSSCTPGSRSATPTARRRSRTRSSAAGSRGRS